MDVFKTYYNSRVQPVIRFHYSTESLSYYKVIEIKSNNWTKYDYLIR